MCARIHLFVNCCFRPPRCQKRAQLRELCKQYMAWHVQPGCALYRVSSPWKMAIKAKWLAFLSGLRCICDSSPLPVSLSLVYNLIVVVKKKKEKRINVSVHPARMYSLSRLINQLVLTQGLQLFHRLQQWLINSDFIGSQNRTVAENRGVSEKD